MFVNPLNLKIGRHTGLEVKAGKCIHTYNDGFECFDDYFSDSESGDCSTVEHAVVGSEKSNDKASTKKKLRSSSNTSSKRDRTSAKVTAAAPNGSTKSRSSGTAKKKTDKDCFPGLDDSDNAPAATTMTVHLPSLPLDGAFNADYSAVVSEPIAHPTSKISAGIALNEAGDLAGSISKPNFEGERMSAGRKLGESESPSKTFEAKKRLSYAGKNTINKPVPAKVSKQTSNEEVHEQANHSKRSLNKTALTSLGTSSRCPSKRVSLQSNSAGKLIANANTSKSTSADGNPSISSLVTTTTSKCSDPKSQRITAYGIISPFAIEDEDNAFISLQPLSKLSAFKSQPFVILDEEETHNKTVGRSKMTRSAQKKSLIWQPVIATERPESGQDSSAAASDGHAFDVASDVNVEPTSHSKDLEKVATKKRRAGEKVEHSFLNILSRTFSKSITDSKGDGSLNVQVKQVTSDGSQHKDIVRGGRESSDRQVFKIKNLKNKKTTRSKRAMVGKGKHSSLSQENESKKQVGRVEVTEIDDVAEQRSRAEVDRDRQSQVEGDASKNVEPSRVGSSHQKVLGKPSPKVKRKSSQTARVPKKGIDSKDSDDASSAVSRSQPSQVTSVPVNSTRKKSTTTRSQSAMKQKSSSSSRKHAVVDKHLSEKSLEQPLLEKHGSCSPMTRSSRSMQKGDGLLGSHECGSVEIASWTGNTSEISWKRTIQKASGTARARVESRALPKNRGGAREREVCSSDGTESKKVKKNSRKKVSKTGEGESLQKTNDAIQKDMEVSVSDSIQNILNFSSIVQSPSVTSRKKTKSIATSLVETEKEFSSQNVLNSLPSNPIKPGCQLEGQDLLEHSDHEFPGTSSDEDVEENGVDKNKENQGNSLGLRRSKRNRVAVLEWYKNERIIYKKRKSGYTVHKIFRPEAIEENKGIKKRKRQNVPAKSEPKMAIHPFDSGPRLSLHRDLPSGLQWEDNSDISVIDDKTKEVVSMLCVRKKDSFKFYNESLQEATRNDKIIICSSLKHDDFSLGILFLAPLAEKMRQKVSTGLAFVVQCGKLAVTIHKTTCILESGDVFYIPPGNAYSVKNLRKENTLLFFFRKKEAV